VVRERLGSRLLIASSFGAFVVPAACVGQPASDANTGTVGTAEVSDPIVAPAPPPPAAPAGDGVVIFRSGDDFEWVSTNNPVCAGDPRPRCPPLSSENEPQDAGVSRDAGDAGTESVGINAAAVVSTMRPGFRDCYVDFLKRTKRPLEGAALLTFHVNCEGYISWIHGTLYGGLDEGAARCLIATARTGRFDRPSGGWAEVRLPVNFVRTGPQPTP
jgi:hypothetical protein